MSSSFQIIGMLLGGIGLFLLSVGMMTNGLKQAAGNSLKELLAKWVDSSRKGVISGFLITAIVQSSSAVTVATIGFVNAGILTLRQSLGVVYGANIGTTITGWLVAIVGFKINIQDFALPLIGVGMLMRLVRSKGKVAAIGMALVGFGLFFVGVDVLKDAFESLVATFDISKFTATGIKEVLIFLLIGIVMTILTQSSSASIALTITAASSGLVGIYAAAAMVIGANVGTTSTALLASIDATINAKRVALAQVIFNVGTGCIALLILPILFLIIKGLGHLLGLSTEPSVTLAMFHTTFNIFGVMLILPLNNKLADYIEKLFIPKDHAPIKTQYIDKNIATTPTLAINALHLELTSIGKMIQSLVDNVTKFQSITNASIQHEIEAIKTLSSEVSAFIVNLERTSLPEETIAQLTTLYRVDQYFLSMITKIIQIMHYLSTIESIHDETLTNKIKQFDTYIWNTLKKVKVKNLGHQLSIIQSEHDKAKSLLLEAGTNSKINLDNVILRLELLSEQNDLARQWLKAQYYLSEFRCKSGVDVAPENVAV